MLVRHRSTRRQCLVARLTAVTYIQSRLPLSSHLLGMIDVVIILVLAHVDEFYCHIQHTAVCYPAENDKVRFHNNEVCLLSHMMLLIKKTSGYATWFTASGAIRIAHYDVIDDIITRKL